IDLGEKYEPALMKLGLPRVLAYDAKLDKSQFAVGDGEFARFVKVVATSIVQGFLTASPVPGAWAQPAEVKVHTAALLITRAHEEAGERPMGGAGAPLGLLSGAEKSGAAKGQGSDQGGHGLRRPAGARGAWRGDTAEQAVNGGIGTPSGCGHGIDQAESPPRR